MNEICIKRFIKFRAAIIFFVVGMIAGIFLFGGTFEVLDRIVKIRTQNERLLKLKQEINEKQAEIDRLYSKITYTEKQHIEEMEKAGDEITELKEKKSKLELQVINIEVEIDTLNNRIDEKDKKYASLQKQLEKNKDDFNKKLEAQKSITPNAKILEVSQFHDIYEDGQYGMKIQVKFSVTGMLNKQGICCAFFYFLDGTALKGFNDHYTTLDGTLSTCNYFKPSNDIYIFNDFFLFIPYDEFYLREGYHDLKFLVGIFDHKGLQIEISDYEYFYYNNSPIIEENSKKESQERPRPTNRKVKF